MPDICGIPSQQCNCSTQVQSVLCAVACCILIDKYTCTVDGPTPTTQVPTSTVPTAGSTGSPGVVSTSTSSGTPISTASGALRSSPGPDHKEPEG